MHKYWIYRFITCKCHDSCQISFLYFLSISRTNSYFFEIKTHKFQLKISGCLFKLENLIIFLPVRENLFNFLTHQLSDRERSFDFFFFISPIRFYLPLLSLLFINSKIGKLFNHKASSRTHNIFREIHRSETARPSRNQRPPSPVVEPRASIASALKPNLSHELARQFHRHHQQKRGTPATTPGEQRRCLTLATICCFVRGAPGESIDQKRRQGSPVGLPSSGVVCAAKSPPRNAGEHYRASGASLLFPGTG